MFCANPVVLGLVSRINEEEKQPSEQLAGWHGQEKVTEGYVKEETVRIGSPFHLSYCVCLIYIREVRSLMCCIISTLSLQV